MRVLNDQVHLGEVLVLGVLSMLTFLIGTSLPLVAVICLLLWPLLLLQMVVEGAFIWLASLWRKSRAPQGPPRPPRTGLARYLWLSPLIALTLGYAWYVLNTGKWFL